MALILYHDDLVSSVAEKYILKNYNIQDFERVSIQPLTRSKYTNHLRSITFDEVKNIKLPIYSTALITDREAIKYQTKIRDDIIFPMCERNLGLFDLILWGMKNGMMEKLPHYSSCAYGTKCGRCYKCLRRFSVFYAFGLEGGEYETDPTKSRELQTHVDECIKYLTEDMDPDVREKVREFFPGIMMHYKKYPLVYKDKDLIRYGQEAYEALFPSSIL